MLDFLQERKLLPEYDRRAVFFQKVADQMSKGQMATCDIIRYPSGMCQAIVNQMEKHSTQVIRIVE